MPSGPMSTMTGATVVPAPPGVFATSMPIELSQSAPSPGSSTEDRDSISSNESHRRPTSMVNGGSSHSHLPPTFASANAAVTSSPPMATSQFVIDSSSNKSSTNKLRKKTKSGRNRVVSPNGLNTSPVNKPLKVTIRRTAPHSHTLDASEQQNRKLSPSSVYSSVPGDDEKSPVVTSGLADISIGSDHLNNQHHHTHHNRNRSLSPLKPEEKTSKPLGYFTEPLPTTRKDVSTSTMDVGTCTEPDILAPCEAGSKIVLEGVVWLETPGMMVINAQWRGKSYLGTLLDASQNTLGPSVPDKMITSLSHFKSKSNWSANPYSAGGHYQRISHNSGPSSSHATPSAASSASPVVGVASGSIKTRSAIALATFDDGGLQTSPTMLATSSRRRPFTGSSSGRGRKRRRGGGVGSSMVDPIPPHHPQHNPDGDDGETPTIAPVTSDTASTPEFTCPQPGCGKLFADILGVRFHLDLVHSKKQRPKQNAGVDEEVPGKEDASTSMCIPSTTGPEDEESEAPKPCSEPPRLAKAKSNTSSFSIGIMDEDQPPPQLDRGPPADEIEQQQQQCGGPAPPAASPAYSDISDDGPAPPRPSTTTRTAANVPHHHPPAQSQQQPPVPPHPHAWVPSATSVTQSQPIDWRTSARGVGGGLQASTTAAKSPYDFNALGGFASPFAAVAAAAAYNQHTATPSLHQHGHSQHQQHHNHRQPTPPQPPPTLHVPSSPSVGVSIAAPTVSPRILQAHIASLMAGVAGTYGVPPPQQQQTSNRQSPHPGSSGRHSYRQ